MSPGLSEAGKAARELVALSPVCAMSTQCYFLRAGDLASEPCMGFCSFLTSVLGLRRGSGICLLGFFVLLTSVERKYLETFLNHPLSIAANWLHPMISVF